MELVIHVLLTCSMTRQQQWLQKLRRGLVTPEKKKGFGHISSSSQVYCVNTLSLFETGKIKRFGYISRSSQVHCVS